MAKKFSLLGLLFVPVAFLNECTKYDPMTGKRKYKKRKR